MNAPSFINDEKGILEPHNDMLATAMMVIGLVVLVTLVSKTYILHDEQSTSLQYYEDASRIAQNIPEWEEIQGSTPNKLSAIMLDTIADPVEDAQRHERFFSRYNPQYRFMVTIETDDKEYRWTIQDVNRTGSGNIIAASIPVVIELNAARSTTGTLTVRLWP